MSRLQTGDPAPQFALEDQNGRIVRASDFRGAKLLLYFYPRAMTPGCTKQSCSVRDALPDLSGLGVAAVGISPDPPERQRRFAEKHSLGFPLLADVDHAVASAYGAWGPKSLLGKHYGGIVRSAFLLDEEGALMGVWYGVRARDTVPNALRALGG